MNRKKPVAALMEAVEPTVIDEELIRKCVPQVVTAQGPGALLEARASDEKGEKKETTDLQEVDTLAFSFRNVQKIDNLAGLEQLVKLQLDNNIISKIENLDHLVNLTWLDLSFNNITRIEGLSSLSKLTDLSLYNNKIASLENMDELTSLQVLSVGNNELAELDNLLYLRRFRHLRLLSMAGNPVCQDPENRSYVIAHCRCLAYLDFRLIDEATVTAAREQFNDELLELEEQERVEEEKAEEERRAKELKAKLTAAHLDLVYVLYQDLLKEDADLPKLRLLPEVVEPLDDLKHAFDELSTEFLDNILKTHEKKDAETALFEATYSDINTENMRQGQKIIEAFAKKKKGFLRQLTAGELSQEEERSLKELRAENDTISDRLLELEMIQVEQYEEIVREYERRMSELVNGNIEQVQLFFARLRELESTCFESMAAQASQEVEKAAAAAAAGAAGEDSDAEEEEEEGNEEVKALLSDKDALMNMLNAGHDARISKIDSREDDMTQREHKQLEDYISRHKEMEYQRNRDRVAEVWGQIDRNRREMDEYTNEDDLEN